MIRTPNRRDFLRTGLLAAACLPGMDAARAAETRGLFSAMGISGSIGRAEFLKQQGAEFLTAGTGDLLCPDQPEEVFAKKLEQALAAPLPVLACNGFIRPAHLRCVGPQATHDEVLAWADIALARLKRVNGKFMVFGSGGARRIPDGWPREKADEQFIALLKRLGAVAEKHGVTVVVEQLQASECNFINRISHAASLIRGANHPHIRLLADLYHMARMDDTPDDLKNAMDVVAHVEIAEKDERTFPGIKGDDFRPFFRVLKQSAWRGAISIEGKGKDEQIAAAFREIAKQSAGI
jgi:sugar phosphate isomerase/epimerase